MKQRNGFVSNSSSSSFIVLFPRRPESSEDVLDMMYGGEVFGITAFDDPISSTDVAKTVWQDIKRQQSLSRMQLHLAMQDAAYDYYEMKKLQASGELLDPWDSSVDRAEQDRRAQRQEEYYEKKGGAATDAFMRKNPDGVVYQFEYSDNSGPRESTMEHGDVFRNLPRHVTSNH